MQKTFKFFKVYDHMVNISKLIYFFILLIGIQIFFEISYINFNLLTSYINIHFLIIFIYLFLLV